MPASFLDERLPRKIIISLLQAKPFQKIDTNDEIIEALLSVISVHNSIFKPEVICKSVTSPLNRLSHPTVIFENLELECFVMAAVR